jgi:hypothetical protein
MNVVLEEVLPGGGGIYDIRIDRGVFLSNTGGSLEGIYPLEVQNDREAIQYYNAINVTNYNNKMYNEILVNIDVDECSVICMKTDACLSYDYNIVQQKCYLSRYSMHMVGGLNKISTEWSHYELNPNKLKLKSNLIVNGEVSVLGDDNIFISIDTYFNRNSSLAVIEGGIINFNRKIEVSSLAGVELCGSLIFDNNNNIYNYNNSNSLNVSSLEKGLTLKSGAYIRGNTCLANSEINSKIIFQNGTHDIYGTFDGNYTLITQNHGNVTIYQNTSKVLHLNSIIIENSSIITVVPLNYTSHMYLKNEIQQYRKNEIEMIMYIENLNIINDGELLLKALKNSMDIGYLTLSGNGLLSAKGSGTKFSYIYVYTHKYIYLFTRLFIYMYTHLDIY